MLREHKLASPYSREWDFVFASERGTPLHYRNVVRRGLEVGLRKAGLGHVRWHDLRHTFASILIAQGENVVWISRQLGHASPSITLNVYSHLFAASEHAERMRSRMEEGFGSVLAHEQGASPLDAALRDRARKAAAGEHDGEHRPRSPGVPAAPAKTADVAQLLAFQTPGE